MSQLFTTALSGGSEESKFSTQELRFYVGLHEPSHAQHFDRCMISVNRLRRRKSDFQVKEWMMDSGAFTELTKYGHYRHTPEAYAAEVQRWRSCGQLVAASSQDYMCEPFVLAKTGLSIAEHQQLTIERYDVIHALCGSIILPVIQGYLPHHYQAHVQAYGERLKPGMWVGVGSVCKRNGSPRDMAAVLRAIKQLRPDLRLHGFGAKLTALESSEVRSLLHSADSMAWSFAARYEGRDANDWREAKQFVARINQPVVLDSRPMDQLWNEAA